MSKIVYLHSVNESYIKNGKKTKHEEYIIEGPRGFMAKYYHKEDDESEKIIIIKKNNDYIYKTIVNDKKDEKTFSLDELLKTISKNKNLKYISDYLKSATHSQQTARSSKLSRLSGNFRRRSLSRSRKSRNSRLSRRSRRSKKGSRRSRRSNNIY